VKIDSPEGVSSINEWLKSITPPDQVLRRGQDGCYALMWTNPNLPGPPAHLVIDVHYTDSGYSLGHCFVNGWEGSLDMSSPLRKAKVAPSVPAKSANGRWPDDPTHTITGGWGPQIPENTNWTVREH
jgi:hypothetical protein